MKKLIIALAIAATTGAAHAVNLPGLGDTMAQNQNQGQNQGQAQGQLQGQAQGQLQGQAQSAIGVGVGVGVAGSAAKSYSGGNSQANKQTNSQSVTVTDSGQLRYSGEYEMKTTGVAPDILTQPTAPCRIAIGAGGGWIGGALSIGGSVEDEGCTRRENARVLAGLGKSDAAVRLLCNDPEVSKVLAECGAPVATSQPVGPQVSYNPSTRTTTVRELNGFNH
jgi:type II secretory pathway pseudopilin PulG